MYINYNIIASLHDYPGSEDVKEHWAKQSTLLQVT